MHNLTIYEISELAGVSITTVSRVLNGSQKVSAKTREKVEAVIREQNFTPKQTARNFTRNDFFAVGLLVDDIRHTYMSELAYAVSQELEKWKLNTILCNLGDVESGFVNQVDNLVDKRVNGIVLLGSVFEKNICRITIERRYSGIPFVTVNSNFALSNVREVMQNQSQGIKDALKYLWNQGKRSIGWIYSNKSSSDKKKHSGFMEGIRECGFQCAYMIEIEEKTLEAGKRATTEILEQHPDLEAVLYSSDTLAVGGVHCLNERKIKIPDQIAVIGFNNSITAKECYPPLTSIDNRIHESGRQAAKMMIDMLNNQETENIQLACGLVIREST